MAIMIPGEIQAFEKATNGEKLLFDLFKNTLDDEFIVYYNVGIDGKYPDFIILSPKFGLIVIETKGWRMEQIIEATPKYFTVIGFSQKQKNPIDQARQFELGLTDELRKYSDLLQKDGYYNGSLIFPRTHAAVFTSFSKDDFRKFLSAVDQDRTLFLNDIEEIKSNPGMMRSWLERIQVYSKSFLPLNEEHVNFIRGIIFPEIRLDSHSIKKNMTLIQERYAKENLNYGHQFIYGISGSGKTIVLLFRAVYLVKTHGNWTVLVLVYNEVTVSYIIDEIRKRLTEDKHDHVKVMSIKSYLTEILNTNKIDYKDNITYGLNFLTHKILLDTQFDAVLIDEGQDFPEEWIYFVIKHSLKGPNPSESHLIITFDGMQNIYKRSHNLSYIGINEDVLKCPSLLQFQNHRNTKQIMQFAKDFIFDKTLCTNISDNSLDPNFAPFIQFESLREGVAPKVIRLNNVNEEIKKICVLLDELIKKGEKNICILYPDKLLTTKIESHLKSNKFSYGILGDGVNNSPIKIGTLEEAKGLTFDVVFLCGILGMYMPNKELDYNKLIFVGITRAREELFIMISQQNLYTKALQSCVDNPGKSNNTKRRVFKVMFTLRSGECYEFSSSTLESVVQQLNLRIYLPPQTFDKLKRDMNMLYRQNALYFQDVGNDYDSESFYDGMEVRLISNILEI